MMSLFSVTIRKKPRGGFMGFQIPMFFLWLLLLPLALLLAPLVFVACLVQEINPFRAFAAFWRTLTALRGTEFELGKNEHSIEVRIT